MNNINIRGITVGGNVVNSVINTSDGVNIVSRNGQVIINGQLVGSNFTQPVEIRVLEGKVDSIQADGSVSCNEVGGNVSAGGSVQCSSVNGRVSAGGSVTCGAVTGGVSAGGSVRAGSIR